MKRYIIMLRLSSAVLIAAMTTSAASAEGIYLGTGFASVNAEEPGYKYGSTNVLGVHLAYFQRLEHHQAMTT